VGGAELAPEIEQRIVEKAGGNPFFIEEIVRELLNRGELVKAGDKYVSQHPIGEVEIPSTIQGVLAARMDRLNDDLKRTMQVASAIGRDFSIRLLKAVVDTSDEVRAHLNKLIALEIIYEKILYPDLEYTFKHALTQEVAYNSLLKQNRQEMHGRIAMAIEKLYTDSLEQHYELLAHHWESSNIPERAIEYLVLSAEKSNRSRAVNSAVDFFTRALNHIGNSETPPDPKLLMRIRAGRANPLQAMGKIEESFEDYLEAIRLAEETGNQDMTLNCLTFIPLLIYNTHLKDETPYYCERGLELARTFGNKSAEAWITTSYAFWRVTWDGSNEYGTIQDALRLAEKSGQPMVLGQVQLYLSLLARWRGDTQKASRLTEGIVERLQSSFSIFLAGGGCFVRGMALADTGKYEEAIRLMRQWIGILENHEIFVQLGRIANVLGWAYTEVYDHAKAKRCYSQSLEIAIDLEKNPAMRFLASHLKAMAEVSLMENTFEMSTLDDAWKLLTRFEKDSTGPDYNALRDRWLIRMKDLKGSILLDKGDLNGAEVLAKESCDFAEKKRYKKYIGKAERLQGQIMMKRSAHDLAEAKFKHALKMLEEVGNPKQLWITHTALARLYEKLKRPDLEREQWQAARVVIESTADELQDEELRTTFINAAPVRKIFEHASR
jgi:tetratricopeptide (TPR) repeat protein